MTWRANISSPATRRNPCSGSTASPAAAAGTSTGSFPDFAMRLFAPAYAELHCLSNFSFLRGASHPQELVERAHKLGYSALAITDECSVAGVVRAHEAFKKLPKGTPLKKLIIG